MRSINQPGPVHPTRVQCAPAVVRAVDIEGGEERHLSETMPTN